MSPISSFCFKCHMWAGLAWLVDILHCSEHLGGEGAGQAWSFWLCRLLYCLILLRYTWVTFIVYKEQQRVLNKVNFYDYACIYCMYAYVWVCMHAPLSEGKPAHVCTYKWSQRYVDLLNCFEPEALTEPRACWLVRLAASQILGLLLCQPAQCWDCRCVPRVPRVPDFLHTCAKDLNSGHQACRAGIWLSHLPRPSKICLDVSRKLWDSPPDSFLWYCCQRLK